VTAEARATPRSGMRNKERSRARILVGASLLILSFMRALVGCADVAFAFIES